MVNDVKKFVGEIKFDFFVLYKVNFIGFCYYYNFWI